MTARPAPAQPKKRMLSPGQLQRLQNLTPSVLATLLRIARRIEEGFEGTIEVQTINRGVGNLKWTHIGVYYELEDGSQIKEELNGVPP